MLFTRLFRYLVFDKIVININATLPVWAGW